MYVCYGKNKQRLSMMSIDYWYPEDLHKLAAFYLRSSSHLDLEYGPGDTVPIYNEQELALAARLVCDHHNKHVNKFDDDHWIQDTAEIWERMLFMRLDERDDIAPVDIVYEKTADLSEHKAEPALEKEPMKTPTKPLGKPPGKPLGKPLGKPPGKTQGKQPPAKQCPRTKGKTQKKYKNLSLKQCKEQTDPDYLYDSDIEFHESMPKPCEDKHPTFIESSIECETQFHMSPDSMSPSRTPVDRGYSNVLLMQLNLTSRPLTPILVENKP